MRILIIDDTPMNLETLAEMLKEKGFDVVTATNGDEGLEIMKEKKFDSNDLILVDLNMPVMDGLEFVEKAKRSGGKSDMKIYTRGPVPNEISTIAKRAGAIGVEGFNEVVNSVFDRLDNVLNQSNKRLKEI